MRSLKIICLCFVALWTFGLQGETFQLNDGRTITGELLLSSANDAGVQIKTGEGAYEKVGWSDFSQAALKVIAQTPKLAPLVEPFIEIPHADRVKKTEVKINRDYPQLKLPPKGSLLGALFGSSIGLICLVLIYGANIYGAYEIAVVRAYPPAMVCGIAAAAPIIGPAVFLFLPTRMENAAQEFVPEPGTAANDLVTSSFAGDPAAAQHQTGLHFAEAPAAAAAAAPAAAHKVEVFQRGQYTFNRRFIETKFAGFFGVVRHGAEKDLVLLFRTPRGEFLTTHITRIAANELHAEVRKGGATAEVTIPFGEIQEVQIKHKDA